MHAVCPLSSVSNNSNNTKKKKEKSLWRSCIHVYHYCCRLPNLIFKSNKNTLLSPLHFLFFFPLFSFWQFVGTEAVEKQRPLFCICLTFFFLSPILLKRRETAVVLSRFSSSSSLPKAVLRTLAAKEVAFLFFFLSSGVPFVSISLLYTCVLALGKQTSPHHRFSPLFVRTHTHTHTNTLGLFDSISLFYRAYLCVQ